VMVVNMDMHAAVRVIAWRSWTGITGVQSVEFFDFAQCHDIPLTMVATNI
jgi:hypothetical protein